MGSGRRANHFHIRLRQKLEEANVGRAIPVSLSIGTASWPEISESCDKLLDVADAAMYEDKRRQKAQSGGKPRDVAQPRVARGHLASVG